MSYIDIIQVTCKNKLCNETATVSRTNGRTPNPFPPCPHCGFKTLDENYISPDIERMIDELIAKRNDIISFSKKK